MDTFYMHLALDVAWKKQLLAYPNPSVGAVLLHDGKLLCVEVHEKSGTSHAEILSLLSGYEILSGKKLDFDRENSALAHEFLRSLPKGFFTECTMYVTLEPCSHDGKTPSCASLLAKLQLKSLFIGTLDPIKAHSGGAKIVQSCGTNVNIGVLEKEANELIEPFVIWQKRAFVLFKLAQSFNGKITGGTISSLDSRTHMHSLRSLCSKLVIGGNTVRIDRPILDCRLSQDNPPNIHIYTQNSNTIDKNIPLFSVKNREVSMGSGVDFLEQPSFVLVEGGENMLNELRQKVDWLLIYQSPNMISNSSSYNIDMKLQILSQQKKGDDLIIWSKKI